MAGCKQSRRLLKYVEDNFQVQVVEEPTRRVLPLGFILTNKEGLVGDM